MYSNDIVKNIKSNRFTTECGIIVDKSGSGKSFVILSIILLDIQQYKLPSPSPSSSSTEIQVPRLKNHLHIYSTNDHLVNVIYDYPDIHEVNTNIIVIPHNLYFQWKDYVEKFSSEYKYMFLHERKQISACSTKPKALEKFNIIFVVSSLYNSFAHELISNNIKVKRIFFDEVDNLYIPSNKKVDSSFYWFITASYKNLVYPHGLDFRSMGLDGFDVTIRGLRNNGLIREIFQNLCTSRLTRAEQSLLYIKNNNDFVDECINMQSPIITEIPCQHEPYIHYINGIIDKKVLEALHADDDKKALELVSATQKITEKNMIDIALFKLNSELTDLEIQIELIQNIRYKTTKARQNKLISLQEQQTTIQRNITNITARLTTTSHCCICYEDITIKTVAICCNNIYCFGCLFKWINNSVLCPLCKVSLTRQHVFVIDNSPETEESTNIFDPTKHTETDNKFTKIKNLQILLYNIFNKVQIQDPLGNQGQQIQSHRVIIYTHYTEIVDQIKELLRKYRYPCEILKGNKNQINKISKDYRSGKNKIIIANSANYGYGLNLECTTDLIFFHKCYNDVKEPIIGRAQRYGRKSQLNIWNMYIKPLST
jgi:hypothetical protein